jgi:hypothetical protein
MVYLRNEHRMRLGICQQNPTPEEVAFVSHLRDGERYTFPDVFTKWMKEPLKESELTNSVPHKRRGVFQQR